MGYGDDLMITGIARIEKKKHPNKQVVIGNLDEKKFITRLFTIIIQT